jgi:asparagine synthase (glutamine-hydrolysing)
MCGICGILNAADHQESRLPVVRAMMDRLEHRGPDDQGTHAGKGVVFGFRRLSIIDLAHGKQPMHSADGRYTLVFNGEIYNYIELRESLVRGGARFRTESDTEVLLQLLIRDGEKALSHLNGMFAFAFIDNQSGQWILARDALGIKPLYYVTVGDELVFASEIKALLVHPQVKAAADWTGVQQYLTLQFCLDEQTLFRGIRKIEPGCFLQGRAAQIERKVRYWDADFRIDDHHTEAYFVDRLRELLADSARIQIRSDVPVGAHLSGGLDSSVVSLLASRQRGGATKAFHGTFSEGAAYDESGYARAAAESSATELHITVATAQQFVDDLPRLIYAMDEPLAGPGLFPQYRVSKLAAEHVKVVLGGQGGDEIFGGYARYLVGYLEQALKGGIFETQEEGRHLVTLASIIPNLPLLQQYQPLLQHFWRDGLFEDMDARYFRLIDRSPDIQHVLSADAHAQFRRDEVYAAYQATFNHPDTKSYINKMTHFDMKTLLPALLHVEDRVSMAVSIESRVPLLDTRIVDLVASMPPQLKFQGGKSKHVLRDAVQGLIPDQVLNRKDKMGFPVPLKEWMHKGPVREFVCDVLLGQKSRQRGLFLPDAIDRLINSEAAFGRQLWGVLCLELWHQQFIDGR